MRTQNLKTYALGVLVWAWAIVAICVGGCAHVTSWASCVGHETEWHPLIAEVTEALGRRDWEAALNALAVRAGWSAVDCAVQEFLTRAEQRLRVGDGAPGEREKAERAREHLRGRR